MEQHDTRRPECPILPGKPNCKLNQPEVEEKYFYSMILEETELWWIAVAARGALLCIAQAFLP